ncbi:hypothetical protein LguiB_028862 [Lonicera macranthoides]
MEPIQKSTSRKRCNSSLTDLEPSKHPTPPNHDDEDVGEDWRQTTMRKMRSNMVTTKLKQ